MLSKAIHKRLNPSKHVLLEPREFYHSILKKRIMDDPEVSQNTILSDLNGYRWHTYTVLEQEHGLADAVPILPPDGEVNKKIFFLGNCTMPQAGGRFATQIIDAVKTGEWLHKYGRIKFVVWADEEFRVRVLPGNLQYYQRYSFIADHFSKITEIAGVPVARVRRFLQTDLSDREKPMAGVLKTGVKKPTMRSLQERERAALDPLSKEIFDQLDSFEKGNIKHELEENPLEPEAPKPGKRIGKADYKLNAFRDIQMIKDKGIELQWATRSRNPIPLTYAQDFSPPVSPSPPVLKGSFH